MVVAENYGVVAGAIVLGAIHGIEPGHGWPVAASYALERSNKWLYGVTAGLVIGIGHLVSSLAMVGAFFYAKSYFDLTRIDDPIVILDGVAIGGPVSLVAGVLLLGLGIREYRHGHAHGHGGETHAHGHGEETHDHHETDVTASEDGAAASKRPHAHPNDGDTPARGRFARLRRRLPFGTGHRHAHDEGSAAADRGLLGIAWFAFVLGFAHEEEFEIIALCAGSSYCLELMVAYGLTVILGIVGLTTLLIAGYQHAEARVERYTPYLPAVSATVLCLMGVGFVTGVF